MARRISALRSFCLRNFLAVIVLFSAGGLFHLNADPRIAGANPQARGTAFTVLDIPRLNLSADVDESGLLPQGDPHSLHGHWAMLMSVMLLERGCESFADVDHYTCQFCKQERVGGCLSDLQTIDLKLRHEPFSIYMRWQTGDRDREVIYAEGLYDGKMLVQPGGIRGRLLRHSLELDPEGLMAMSESRYPIYRAGILELSRTLLNYHRQYLERGTGYRCLMRDDQLLDDRPCYLFVVEHDSAEVSPEYRKSIIMIDRELLIPVCVKNFGWPDGDVNFDLDEETLLELYTYTNIEFRHQIADVDFDRSNDAYRFR